MELKTTDLRIGNYLKTDNSTDHYIDVIKVESIQYDGINITDGIGNSYVTEFEWDFLKPIPITVEWLKRAGYKQLKRVEKTYSLGSFEDNSAIFYTGVRFVHINTGTQLDFVHEWQNLYAAIYKQELKFQ